jgi:hypothetical protein
MSNYLDAMSPVTRTSSWVLAAAGASIIFVSHVTPSATPRYATTPKLDTAAYQASLHVRLPITTFSSIIQPSVAVPTLADLITAERIIAKIDEANVGVADAAARDAVAIVRRANLCGTPLIMFSHDGILALQWQRGEYGVALVFAGDGEASISFRRPGQLYAENGIDVAITDDLPVRFNEALSAILV